jgi:hypothetical protein
MSSFSGAAKLAFIRSLGDSWAELADYLEIPPYEKARWRPGDQARDLWEWLETRGRLDELPGALKAVDREDLVTVLGVPGGVTVPRPRPRRTHVLAAAAALIVMAAGYLLLTRQGGGYVYLKQGRPASPAEWTATLDCTPRTEWIHGFDPAYTGDVYVQFAADARTAVETAVTLSWGGRTWSGSVEAAPGAVARHLGGTMLKFQKRDADQGPAPGVHFASTVPVCAVFGTAPADDTAPAEVIPTPGWK